MVDGELQFGMTLGDPTDLRQEAGRRDHDRQPGALGFAPDPTCWIVEPSPRRAMTDDAPPRRPIMTAEDGARRIAAGH